jgi:hypothetical protein
MSEFLEQINNRLDSSYTKAGNVVSGSNGNVQGFSDLATIPNPTGSAVRQAQISNERDAIAKRNMVRWFLPETGIVEMYVNPKNIVYNYRKHIAPPVRTRGGYVIQYYGEDLGSISISGTTGSSGVEGINVLEEVYRNEQVSMDAIAMAAQAAREEKANSYNNDYSSFSDVLGSVALEGVNDIFDTVDTVLETGSTDPELLKPTLASIAFQTEMYWSGWVFRGYFTQFTVTESSDLIGLFEYRLEYNVTQKRGLRLNFMPWHRSAVNGPSYTDPNVGVPYSFGALKATDIRKTSSQVASRILPGTVSGKVDFALQSYRPIK